MTKFEKELKLAKACVKRCREELDDALMIESLLQFRVDKEALLAMAAKCEVEVRQ